MAQKIQAIRGMNDYLPADTRVWQKIENTLKQILAGYGFSEIRTPIVEHTPLFQRAIGEVTDVVEKEMYTFTDRGEDAQSLTLRPENTAGCVRAGIEHGLLYNQEQRLWYLGPMFRYERPQAGRLRQFHQIGVECFGSSNPATDVETIAMAAQFLKELGIDNVTLHLKTLGSPASRQAYRQALIDYLLPMKDQLSKDSQRRLEENPLRVLDSKEKEDKAAVEQAPSILDYLDEESQAHFDAVRRMLEDLGVAYVIDTNMVRGLDYYNHTIFEFITEIEGNELTVCAGGRYDGLVEYFGGPATAGFGFGIGVERILLVLEKKGIELPIETGLDAYIAVLGDEVNEAALSMVQALRIQGFKAERDYLGRKLKAQFKSADVFAAKALITLGSSEVESGQVTVKNNQTRQEVTVALEKLKKDFPSVLAELGLA